jgi:hypothetical protein
LRGQDHRFAVAAAERRAKGRKRVNLAAKLALGTTVADCTVRDLSDAGGRIEAPFVRSLPDEVFLLILDEGVVVRARCTWARLPSFGLKFIDAESIEESTRPETAVLRLAWKAFKEPTAPTR